MSWLLSFLSPILLGVQAGNRLVVKRALNGLTLPSYRIRGERISAIIPTHNEEDYIGECLTCLQNQTYFPIEVIVVDFESQDQTRQIARAYGAKIVDMRVPGVGNARDIGVLYASSDTLFFSDADVIFENRLVEEMVKDLENGWDVITVPAVYYDTAKPVPINPLLNLGMNISRLGRAPWILSGRATLTRKETWRQVGGWELPIWEERHFGRKLNQAGYKINMRRRLALTTPRFRESRAMRLQSIQGVREPFKYI